MASMCTFLAARKTACEYFQKDQIPSLIAAAIVKACTLPTDFATGQDPHCTLIGAFSSIHQLHLGPGNMAVTDDMHPVGMP